MTWLDALAAEPYEQRGILHSEMAFVIHAIKRAGVQFVIESGRHRAQSTVMLAKYLPEVTIVSIEARDNADVRYGIERCNAYPNIKLASGSAFDLLPMLAESATVPTAILMDGPKGEQACGLLRQCFDSNPQIRLGFIHDMRRLDHGGPSAHRACAERTFARNWFSDDPRLVRHLQWLDEKIAHIAPCGSRHEQEYGSYGPTVGVFYNDTRG